MEDLYLTVFGEESGHVPESLLTNDWKEIGFQNKNPRIDFRGGGVLSLHCLRYFIRQYPELFKQMLQCGSEYFFISLTSINISHFLIIYLYMNKDKIPEEHNKVKSTR